MGVNDNASFLNARVVWASIASRLAPTVGRCYFKCCFSSSDACNIAERTAGTWLTTLSKP
ncbi:hypothetical protein C8K63_11985 [Pseudomonas sp. GV085]|nr:hypothetical protein C8K63_11985 [Pseudomonas sp. GV085]